MSKIRELLFPINDKDKERNRVSRSGTESVAGGEGDDIRNESSDYIETGERSKQWFDDIEEKVEENTERSRENQMYLTRMDYRTVWIMRLMVGIMTAILVGAIGQFFHIPV